MHLYFAIGLFFALFAQAFAASPRDFRQIANSFNGINFLFGSCSVPEYYEREQSCTKLFFDRVRKNRMVSPNCSSLYMELKECALEGFRSCLRNSTLESFLANYRQLQVVEQNFMTFFGAKDRWCKWGGITATQVLHEGTNCAPIYHQITQDCVSVYHRVFNSRSSSWRLCREYNRAKTCLFRAAIGQCSFTRRPLQQMMKLTVEMEMSFQPYCQKRNDNPAITFDSLLSKDTCPPWSNADILFVVDASNKTDDVSFSSMKSAIGGVISKLKYGMNGIRAGFAQFHETASLSIRLNRYPTAKSFLRGLGRTNRINGSGSRATGGALNWLAANLYGSGGGVSVVRPHHTPIVVLLSTGKSDDAVWGAIRKLTDRNVHVIRVGPHLRTRSSPMVTSIRTRNATSFTRQHDALLREICEIDSKFRNSQSPGIESFSFGSNSPLHDINRKFLRFGFTHLPLLWRPQAVNQSNGMRPPTGGMEQGIGTGYNGNITSFESSDDFLEELVF